MTIQGVDVSKWQGVIQWSTLATRARFAFIKLSEGTVLDPRGAVNWAQSKGKLPRGAYCFFHPEVDALLQAHVLVNACGDDLGELPFVVDVEAPATAWSQAMRDSLRTCLEGIERLCSRKPLLYTGSWFWPYVGNAPWAANYPLWIAQYVDGSPAIPALWKAQGHLFWQYSSTGNGPDYGCTSQAIDLNQFKGDEAAWAAYIGKEAVPMSVMNQYNILNPDGSVLGTLSIPGTVALVTPPPPPPPPPPAAQAWHIDWYAGAVPGTGAILKSVDLAAIAYKVDSGPLEDGLPVDNVCARATRSIWFVAGTYKVSMRVDDGGRVKIDDKLIVESWKVQSATTYEAIVTFPTDAQHNVIAEYVEYSGWAEWSVTITPYVAPPPPPTPEPPPAAVVKAGLGVHTLTSVKGIQQAQAAGCQVFLAMNRPDEACALATGDPTKWYPGCGYPFVMYRIYHDTVAWSPDDMISQLAGLTENPNPNKKNVVITLCNEWDINIPAAGNSADGMRKFCDWTIACIQKLNAKGFYNIAIFSASMGTPEFNDSGVCDVIRQKIAPLWNNGTIRFLDYHSYSPNKDSIYKTDGSQVWFERRWEFFYTRCGFSPTAPGKIVSGEGGLDEGGIGSYVAHQMDRNATLAHMTRTLIVQQAPLVVNGVSYPSPFLAVAVFQGDPDDQRWAGYRTTSYYPLVWAL